MKMKVFMDKGNNIIAIVEVKKNTSDEGEEFNFEFKNCEQSHEVDIPENSLDKETFVSEVERKLKL
jgi:hypothetical protein